jgi:hypothetical protein
MKIYFFVTLSLFLALAKAGAQQQEDAAYLKTLTDRSQKIINALDINDPDAYQRVTGILVNQYQSLGTIHDAKDAEEVKNLKLYNLHSEFIGRLASELTPEQIDKVKDGMTYGVVKVTYDSYCDMIPTLKPEEKKQLMAWLIEAREHAMDAASSNKKHEWFGKYKGRFNNYLSQQGYDSQKERQEWEERRKSGQDRQSKANLEVDKKASEWVASLALIDEAKAARVQKLIAGHLKTVRDWHNNHDYMVVPEGINPRTGGVLTKLDRGIIIDSTLPKEARQTLMDGLKKELTEEQIALILDKYTIGKVAFTMKAYKEIVQDMTSEEETTILNYLKQAREEAIDYKSMEQVSAIFKIYKTKIELYLYQNGRNWKAIYKTYVDSLKKK